MSHYRVHSPAWRTGSSVDMSARSTIELAGACIVMLTAFLAAVFWIQAGDAEAAQKGMRAVSLHEQHHTAIDTALLNRMSRLESKVDTNVVYLRVLEERSGTTINLLEALLK